MKATKKSVESLIIVFVIVFSVFVLSNKIPETKFIQNTIESLEDNSDVIMKFSGATLTTSLAISALPNDFATPYANTLADMNIFFIFISAIILIEKLIVIIGIKFSFQWIIPIACGIYLFTRHFHNTYNELLLRLASKLLILGLSIILVIPMSTHFTQNACNDYLAYVNNTIEETKNGADKINDVVTNSDDNRSILDKLSDLLDTATKGVSDLLTYFKNTITKCISSIAVLFVTNFILPILILFIFKWILKEIFNLSINIPQIKIRLPEKKHKPEEKSRQEKLDHIE